MSLISRGWMVQTLADGTVSLPKRKAATSIDFKTTFFFEKNGMDRFPLQYLTASVLADVSRLMSVKLKDSLLKKKKIKS